ncbi:hypothetical protein KO525_17685 [Psychrosphaera sp. B3R10]|uniref:RHS repeat domain-containing protein n=1 Tax=Psychrosphaera sp. I2R16 TaxID=2841558 RepID=UPI001C0A4668|nr:MULTISPECIES: RHS repeat-associated core domain-containing protein [unclassified Psychrosphaera]MBU2881780.1 hypothetical protein [Psychrosphaera sp. I2R16]MBU2991214.1 hypothetical protein [Psychrosphaera sp. B3R10]
MNGRIYDYNLGRFMSVDPFIQAPTNTQSINPYSYIMNNPMAGTDPTGYLAKSSNASNWRTSACDLDNSCPSTPVESAMSKYLSAHIQSCQQNEMSRARRQEHKNVGITASFNTKRKIDDSNDGFGDEANQSGLYDINKAMGIEKNGINFFVVDDGSNDAGKRETIEYLDKLTSDPDGEKLLKALGERKVGQVLIFKDTGMTNKKSDLNFAAENGNLKFVAFDTRENPSVQSIRGDSFTSTWQRRLTH